jgi:hypothetical protein
MTARNEDVHVRFSALDLRQKQMIIFETLHTVLELHKERSDLFTRVAFAFLPFVYESK